MGNRSHFTMTECDAPSNVREAMLEWARTNRPDALDYLRTLLNDDSLDNVRWYDHEEDMAELSTAFPSYQFIIEVEGDERSDNWASYTTNGECLVRRAKLVWEPAPW